MYGTITGMKTSMAVITPSARTCLVPADSHGRRGGERLHAGDQMSALACDLRSHIGELTDRPLEHPTAVVEALR
jgi:hypothetical protein